MWLYVCISAAHLMESTKLVSQLRKELQVCDNIMHDHTLL